MFLRQRLADCLGVSPCPHRRACLKLFPFSLTSVGKINLHFIFYSSLNHFT